MFKKITLALFIAFASSFTIVSCSSDNYNEYKEFSAYDINPPAWLQGTWANSYGEEFTFTVDDIQISQLEQDSWRFRYDNWNKLMSNNKSEFYDKAISPRYYEAEYLYYMGVLDSNIKVYKLGANAIEIRYTYYDDDGSIFSMDIYELSKVNE